MNLEQIKTTWALRRAARYQHDPQIYRNWAIVLGTSIVLGVMLILVAVILIKVAEWCYYTQLV